MTTEEYANLLLDNKVKLDNRYCDAIFKRKDVSDVGDMTPFKYEQQGCPHCDEKRSMHDLNGEAGQYPFYCEECNAIMVLEDRVLFKGDSKDLSIYTDRAYWTEPIYTVELELKHGSEVVFLMGKRVATNNRFVHFYVNSYEEAFDMLKHPLNEQIINKITFKR